MNILLTGSEGYIGTILGDELLRAGYTVTGLDTGYYRSGWLYNGATQIPQLLIKDIRSVTQADLAGFDVVIHLAELSNDPLGQIDANLTNEINHGGTKNLIDASKAAGVKRFIYFSSCSVYGASDEVRDETSPTNPLTAYAKCKVLNEQYLISIATETFSPVVFRNATVYGASPRMRFDLVVNNLSGLAWTTKEIKMDSDGTPWRPLVHVKDVANAVVCTLKAPASATHKHILNIGNTRSNYQIAEVAKTIGSVFPDATISLNKNGADKRNYKVNFDKITKLLPDFRCKYTVEDGAKELYSIFSKIEMSKDMFLSKDFTRLKTIQYLKDTHQIDDHLFWRSNA